MSDNPLELLRSDARRRRDFLRGARDEIRSENLSVACSASVFTVFILLGCLAITPLVIRPWSPSVFHVAFVPAMVVLSGVICAYRARSRTQRLSTPLCLLLECTIIVFGILIDTAADPTAPAVFTRIIIVALSALFIQPLFVSYLLAALFSTLYAVLAVCLKVPHIAQYDVLAALVTFVFSVCSAYIAMRHRVATYEAKTHYRELSMQDDLSRVLNKRTLLSLVAGHFASAGPTAPCTLVFFDVDGLKAINDTRGHMTGDELLRTVGNLLQGGFRSTDVVGRFGGDEYVVFIPEAIEEPVLARKIASIRADLAAWSEERLGITASLSAGAVVATHGHHDVTELLRAADGALYEAKRAGKNRLVYRGCEGEAGAGADA